MLRAVACVVRVRPCDVRGPVGSEPGRSRASDVNCACRPLHCAEKPLWVGRWENSDSVLPVLISFFDRTVLELQTLPKWIRFVNAQLLMRTLVSYSTMR